MIYGGTNRFDTEQLMQELLFWLYENQEVTTKYQGKDLKFSFDIDTQVIDNSDLTQYESEGKLYRYSLNILAHCILFRSENYFTVLHPNIKVEPKN